MSAARGAILVLDADQAAALAVVRSLGRAGHEVHVADRMADPLSARSRYCRGRHRYPPPMQEPERFLDFIEELLRSKDFEAVFPITDDSLQPLAGARRRFADLTKLAIAPEPGLEIFTDKEQTLAIAKEVGIPCPEGTLVENESDLEHAAEAASFPVVVKPARSVTGAEGEVRTMLSVRYGNDRDELVRLGREALKHGPVLLQEYAKGDGVGVELLCAEGEVIASFQHRRLHEWPLTGGGSSYRVSEAVDETLLADARRLMKAARYHGVAMVEFKHDRESGERRLMEVNARFWGSLPLCTASGCDFPLWYRDLLVEGKRPLDPHHREGIRCRKFTRDLFWSVEVLRRSDPNPLIRWPSRLSGLTTWLGVLHPKHRFDVQRLGDMSPGWLDLRRGFGALFGAFRKRRRRLAQVREMAALRDDRALLERRLKGAHSLLLLCYGNINRSALAAADLERRLGATGREIVGAGFHEREDRPMDANMLALAREVGLELDAHRSRRVRKEDLRNADLILAMDVSQLERLAEDHPEVSGKTLLYGVLDEEESVEIPDPYGGDQALYRRVRDRLIALGEIVERISRQG